MKTTPAKKQKSLPNPVGRPPIITPEIVAKLEEVFAIGGTDEEACFYANIGKSTLYEYQKINPEFVERKESLKQRPILKARQTIVKSLDIPQHAQWYLARKRNSEFSERTEVKIEDTKTNEVIEELRSLAHGLLNSQRQ